MNTKKNKLPLSRKPSRHAGNSYTKCQQILSKDREYSRNYRANKKASATAFTQKLAKMLKVGLRSPTKAKQVKQLMSHYQPAPAVDTQLVSHVMTLSQFKAKNRWKQFYELTDTIKTVYGNLRQVENQSGITYHKLRKIFQHNAGSVTQRKKTSIERKEHLNKYIRESESVIHLPDAKHANKLFLVESLRESYIKYVDHCKATSRSPYAFSSFCRNRGKDIKTFSDMPDRQCVCEKCENLNMLIKALHGVQVTSVQYSIRDCLAKTMCTPENGEKFEKLVCVKRSCEFCGVDRENAHLRNVNARSLATCVTWHQWVAYKKPDGNVKHKIDDVSGTVGDLIDAFTNTLHMMSLHQFNAVWSSRQYRCMKENLVDGVVLKVLDFGQNYLNVYQDEIQSAHWDHNQTTIHPIVCTYICRQENCKHRVVHEQIFLSPDKDHDHYMVAAFQKISEDELKKYAISTKFLVEMTDNCSKHYKSRNAFSKVTSSDIPTTRCYFGESHGKSDADGATGRTKQSVTKARKSRQAIIKDAMDFYEYCKANLEKLPTPGCGKHHVITFHLVIDVDRNVPATSKTIIGSSKFHQVRSVGTASIIEGRDVVCLCIFCLFGIGTSCENASHTGEWRAWKIDDVSTVNAQKITQWENSHFIPKPHKIDAPHAMSPAQQNRVPCHIDWSLIYDSIVNCSTYEQLQAYVATLPPFDDVPMTEASFDKHQMLDEVACHAKPHDFEIRDRIPAATVGDGNCCFRAFSRAIFGHERQHFQFRVRYIVEAVTHEHDYCNSRLLSRGASVTYNRMSMAGIFTQYSEEYIPADDRRLTSAVVQEYYRREIMAVRHTRVYSGLWQLAGMATVLNRPVRCIFPPMRGDARLDFHRMMYPGSQCDGENNPEIVIMWAPSSNGGKIQHFVPLLKVV